MSNLPAPLDLALVEDDFCRNYAMSGDALTAYRSAYKCPTVSNRTARRESEALLKRPEIQARITEIVSTGKTLSAVNMATVLTHWINLATADVNEVVQHRRNCCRYCYGVAFKYQWTETEYWDAVAKAIDAQKPQPDNTGGFDYDRTRGPNPDCPECGGEGIGEVYVADTRYLSPQGKLLYAGVKQTRYGIEVNTENRTEAWRDIARFLGMFVERVKVEDLTRKEKGEEALDLKTMTPEALTSMFRELVQKR